MQAHPKLKTPPKPPLLPQPQITESDDLNAAKEEIFKALTTFKNLTISRSDKTQPRAGCMRDLYKHLRTIFDRTKCDKLKAQLGVLVISELENTVYAVQVRDLNNPNLLKQNPLVYKKLYKLLQPYFKAQSTMGGSPKERKNPQRESKSTLQQFYSYTKTETLPTRPELKMKGSDLHFNGRKLIPFADYLENIQRNHAHTLTNKIKATFRYLYSQDVSTSMIKNKCHRLYRFAEILSPEQPPSSNATRFKPS